MKKFNQTIILLLLGLFLFTGAYSQDQRTLETKVADVLTQVPTYDLDHRDRVMEQMISLGEEGLSQFANMIVPPGTGDDTRARFALGSLALYVGQPGQDDGHKLLTGLFNDVLSSNADNEVKAFFLYHLSFFGGADCAEAVAPLLGVDRLNEAAINVLVSMKDHSGLKAVKMAFPKLSGKNQMRAVIAMGEFQAPCAVSDVTALAGSGDEDMQQAVLFTLAEIADPSSAKLLGDAAKNAGYKQENTRAAASYVRYAERLAEKGELELSEKICRSIMKKAIGPGQITYANTALSIMVDNMGYEVLPDLLKGFDNSDKKYRGAMLRYASQITDIAATREWMEKYEEVNSAQKQELISFFRQRDDLTVVPLLKGELKSIDSGVKLAALDALGYLVGPDVLPSAINMLKEANSDEAKEIQNIVRRLVGPNQVKVIAGALPDMTPIGQKTLVEVLSERAASDYFMDVYKLTESENADVKATAFAGLKSMADESRIKPLLRALYNSEEEQYIPAVQSALVAAAKTIDGEEKQAKPILDAYSSATKNQDRFYAILAQLGGSKSLDIVADAFREGDSQMKEAAFEALVSWKDHSAAAALYDVCESGNRAYQDKAFTGYVNQVKKASIPADQKLLLMRKIMGQAKNTAQREMVINSLSKNKTFLTLIFVGKYLNDSDLKNAAGRACATIAMPPSGSQEGMYGTIVKDILNKSIGAISGEESDYIKANIRTWLENMPNGEGYVSMFNGKDLSGWEALVENPIKRAAMKPAELAKKQAAADALLSENWVVENGEIRFIGTGYQNLCSIKDYADFEMLVDWRINKKGDSGIYLRGTPQVQIWDTSRVESGAQVGSGGLYNNQKNERIPLMVADNPIPDWSTFYIKMIGERVTVYLNGMLVVDNVVLENYWDRSIPIFPSEAIELQAHGTDLGFRDIYVREISSEDYNLSVTEKADGFKALFNGKNLEGWIGNKVDYSVVEGNIVIDPKGGGSGNLFTEKEYADFNYRFEFQLTPGANNGLGIRTPPQGDAAYAGMELQILDNTSPIYAKLQPYQYHGSVYGVIPAKRGFLKPVGEWNEEEVIVQGTRVKVILNGEVIVDGDIAGPRDNGTMDHKNHPGLKRDKGHIGFLGHGSVVSFRNIRIKEL